MRVKVAGLLLALLASFPLWSQTRMAPEFEFDLSYFKEGSPIRRYIDVPYSDAELLNIDWRTAPPASAVFKPKSDLAPKTVEILSRFEFEWETMFKPPKLEIRYKNPLNKESVKSDVAELIKLFSKNKTEYEEMIKHLSSIRAETPDRKHLNLHIHSSDPDNLDRIEAYRRYQLLSALELAAHNPQDARARIFDSVASSYTDMPWIKGISKSIGLSRFESRKRSVNIFEEIDRLDDLHRQNPESLTQEYNRKIQDLATTDLLKDLTQLSLHEERTDGRIDFFEDLYLLSPENSLTRKRIVELVTENDLSGLKTILSTSDVSRRIKFLSIFVGDSNITPETAKAINKQINLDLLKLSESEKIEIMRFFTQNLSVDRQKVLFDLLTIRADTLPSLNKAAKRLLKKDPSQWKSDFAGLLFINSEALPEPVQDSLTKLRSQAFKRENFPFLNPLHYYFFDSPLSALRALNPDQQKVFLEFLSSESDELAQSYIHLLNDLTTHQGKADHAKSRSCKDAIHFSGANVLILQ